ncbi:outer membrane protein assembly factor BamB [Caldimonas tepidiphila]|uniref:outer membrane protein assembly factor BamB n=1 Tax=Caldimonas tepidiphila TaxID=2315841 RepID=UPI000E5C47E0|nr:outer membrane protein assembly factor BamB [Caldimonas tepidiphila]
MSGAARLFARLARPLPVLALAALLGACSSTPEKPKPTPLEPLAPALTVRPVWNQRIGTAALPLRIATQGNAIVVASSNGTVAAFAADSGQPLWRGAAGAEIGAGVGSDARRVAVVTRGGDLVVMESGTVRWKQPLGARSLTAPLLAGERVFVYGTDRSVQAFDADSGTRLWRLQRPGDPLTLAQPGVLLPVRDTLLVGQGTRLAGLDPLHGTMRWDVLLASPRGTNEVERLADLVGPAARVGDMVCARAYQAAVACVNADSATLAWSRNTSGAQGLQADERHVYGADSTDRITAWRRANGEVAWQSERFRFRGLGSPALAPSAVVFGDGEGWVHLLSRDDGRPLARVSTDGSPVVGAPVLAAGNLVVVTRSGGVFAFRIE